MKIPETDCPDCGRHYAPTLLGGRVALEGRSAPSGRFVKTGPNTPMSIIDTHERTAYRWVCGCGRVLEVVVPRLHRVRCQDTNGNPCHNGHHGGPGRSAQFPAYRGSCPCHCLSGWHWLTGNDTAPCGAAPGQLPRLIQENRKP